MEKYCLTAPLERRRAEAAAPEGSERRMKRLVCETCGGELVEESGVHHHSSWGAPFLPSGGRRSIFFKRVRLCGAEPVV